MMNDKIKASALVAIQFLCFLLIAVSGRIIAHQPLWLTLEVAGLVLGFWAFYAMGWRNLRTMPLIPEEARLVTDGPYRLIRHPMYTAVLLVVWALIIDDFSLFRLASGLVLTLNQIIKLLYEEHLLMRHFPEYTAYMRTSKRLIPFII
jgi:protein-S-isoprenylcysteine O-methyltransferase Ste14